MIAIIATVPLILWSTEAELRTVRTTISNRLLSARRLKDLDWVPQELEAARESFLKKRSDSSLARVIYLQCAELGLRNTQSDGPRFLTASDFKLVSGESEEQRTLRQLAACLDFEDLYPSSSWRGPATKTLQTDPALSYMYYAYSWWYVKPSTQEYERCIERADTLEKAFPFNADLARWVRWRCCSSSYLGAGPRAHGERAVVLAKQLRPKLTGDKLETLNRLTGKVQKKLSLK